MKTFPRNKYLPYQPHHSALRRISLELLVVLFEFETIEELIWIGVTR